METSIMIAQFISVPLLAAGVGMIVDSKYYHKMIKAMMKDSSQYFMLGIITSVVGVAVVMNHNIWIKNWEVIITIWGWAALIKGILLLAFPEAMMDMGKVWLKKNNILMVAAVFYLVIGGVLGYYGFLA